MLVVVVDRNWTPFAACIQLPHVKKETKKHRAGSEGCKRQARDRPYVPVCHSMCPDVSDSFFWALVDVMLIVDNLGSAAKHARSTRASFLVHEWT